MIRSGAVLGVLDVDSPRLHRFDEIDRHGLEGIVATLLASTETWKF
jgi:GAF domain-containing protein